MWQALLLFRRKQLLISCLRLLKFHKSRLPFRLSLLKFYKSRDTLLTASAQIYKSRLPYFMSLLKFISLGVNNVTQFVIT
jgi:hypothetical protein